MNELQIFKNEEFGQVRTMEMDGEYWFVGKDVADSLGYKNSSKAVLTHVDKDDRKLEMIAHSQNGNMVKTQTSLINESGLYSLILGSKLPNAKKFKKWVTSEVIPSLRKHGSYSITTQQPNEMVANLVQSTMTAIFPIITEQMAKVTIQNQQQINQMAGLIHDQADIYDNDRENLKELIGFKSANTSRMVNTIKDKLSDKLGYKVMANNSTFQKVKGKVFKKYEVIKWEDIPVEKYNDVFAFIDTYIEDEL